MNRKQGWITVGLGRRLRQRPDPSFLYIDYRLLLRGRHVWLGFRAKQHENDKRVAPVGYSTATDGSLIPEGGAK